MMSDMILYVTGLVVSMALTSVTSVYVGVFINRIIGIHFLSEARRIVVLISDFDLKHLLSLLCSPVLNKALGELSIAVIFIVSIFDFSVECH